MGGACGSARAGGRAVLSGTKIRNAAETVEAASDERGCAAARVAAPATPPLVGRLSIADHDKVVCVQVFGLIEVEAERYAFGIRLRADVCAPAEDFSVAG